MRDFEQEPLRVQTQRNYRLEMRVLTLPRRTAGLWMLALFLYYTARMLLPPHRISIIWLFLLFIVVRYWVMPYGHTSFDDPDVRNDSVDDHIVCLSDRVVSRSEHRGVVQEKTVPYIALRFLIETKDLLCLYDSPITANVICKTDLRSDELEQLRATILKAVADIPPPKKDIYRKIGWWKGPKAEHA